MLGDGRTEIHVVDPVGRADQHSFLVCALKELLIQNDVPEAEPGVGHPQAVGRAGQEEHAALLGVQAPFPAHVQMVRQGAVVAGRDHADGVDAGIHHGGEGKVDQTVAAPEGNGRHGTIGDQLAVVRTGIVGRKNANDIAHDEYLLTRFSCRRPAGRWARFRLPCQRWCRRGSWPARKRWRDRLWRRAPRWRRAAGWNPSPGRPRPR